MASVLYNAFSGSCCGYFYTIIWLILAIFFVKQMSIYNPNYCTVYITENKSILFFCVYILGFFILSQDWCCLQSLTGKADIYIVISCCNQFDYQFRSFYYKLGGFLLLCIDNSVINKQPASFVVITCNWILETEDYKK